MPLTTVATPLRIAVVDDVRRLQQRRFAQPAYRAARGVRAQHRRAEAMLMQSDERLARCVAPYVVAGDQTGGRGVGDRKPRLELDELGPLVDGDDESRRDHGVLPGSDAAEVNQRHGELVRREEGAVVGGRL